MRILLARTLAVFCAIALAGCAAGSQSIVSLGSNAPPEPASLLSPETTASTANGEDRAGAPVDAMRLQSGDNLRVTVYGEEKLSGEYLVDPSGYVSLPLAGTTRAAGLTKIELEQMLTKKFKSKYLRDPKVTVDVASYRPIYVLGEVQKPGEYAYRSGLNVVSALAVAGGATYRASKSKVLIQRSGEKQLKEHEMDPAIPVMPGDVVRVPERYF
jgi:polysaccharide biosynthesis/export protein